MEINVKSENQSGGSTIGQVITSGGSVVEQAKQAAPPVSFWEKVAKTVREHLVVAVIIMILTAVLAYFGFKL